MQQPIEKFKLKGILKNSGPTGEMQLGGEFVDLRKVAKIIGRLLERTRIGQLGTSLLGENKY